jgi:hypothetical protein
MRYLCAIGLGLLLACGTAQAENAIDVPGPSTSKPNSTDVIAQLYQFDLFQQNAIDGVESLAIPELVNTASTRADAAVKRDRVLAELERQAGAVVKAHEKNAAMRAHALAGVDSSDGPAYVREFYQAQLVEYEAVVGLLERYLQSPDNDDVSSFAAAQLPILRAELMDTKSALTDK